MLSVISFLSGIVVHAQDKTSEVLQELKWSTYIGGSGYEMSRGITLDVHGNVYIVGQTSSLNFEVKNPYQEIYGGGVYDGFISKYSSTGEMLWSSYYGGSGQDEAFAICSDADGNIYMAGRTNSNSGIAFNGFKNSVSGGFDAFMVKYNSIGQRLWGTYYGGTGDEIVYDIDLDNEGNIYMAGETGSSSGIAYNGFSNSGSGAFLVKFNSSGNRIWATYYNGATYCRSVEVDKYNNVYISGMTGTASGMAFNGYQNSSGGYFDGFLVKFNSEGQRLWATYYGGSNWDCIRDIATDNNGNVFISGETYSNNGIAFNGYMNTFKSIQSDWSDAFIVKFNAEGARQWGTYFGGSDHDGGFGVTTDYSGNLYLLTSMRSSSGIAFKAFKSNNSGGYNDIVLAKFNPNCDLIWATYYGGNGIEDYGKGILDGKGHIFITGRTGSTSGISVNGHQNKYGGADFDGFLVKFFDFTYYPVEDIWYRDKDRDGYGNSAVVVYAATPPNKQYVAIAGDCNDNNNTVYPGAPELPDGRDNNCNGEVDEGLDCRKIWYRDTDGDGYGRNALTKLSCVQPNGYVLTPGDCNDHDPTRHPGAPELCDGIDNNCNGLKDENCAPSFTVKPLSAQNAEDLSTGLHLWPNPATNDLTVLLEGFVVNKPVELVISAADGRAIQSQQLMPAFARMQVTLKLNSIPDGYFILQARQGHLVKTKPFLIVR